MSSNRLRGRLGSDFGTAWIYWCIIVCVSLGRSILRLANNTKLLYCKTKVYFSITHKCLIVLTAKWYSICGCLLSLFVCLWRVINRPTLLYCALHESERVNRPWRCCTIEPGYTRQHTLIILYWKDYTLIPKKYAQQNHLIERYKT